MLPANFSLDFEKKKSTKINKIPFLEIYLHSTILDTLETNWERRLCREPFKVEN